MLLGSSRIKALIKTVVKLTPGVNFINILQAAFTPKILIAQNRQTTETSHQCLFALLGLRTQKPHVGEIEPSC